MVEHLDPHALAELERQLGLRLGPTAPTPAERRVDELGFLADLLEGREPTLGGFAVIERQTYDAAHAGFLAALQPSERTIGASVPPSSETLVARYGSWLRVCYAAHGLQPDGSTNGHGRPWPAGFRGRGAGPLPYTRREIIDAVRACAFTIGRRPSAADYVRWSLHQRALARVRGLPCRIPTTSTVYRRFPRLPRGERWRRILLEAAITDEELRAARAAWVPGGDPASSAAGSGGHLAAFAGQLPDGLALSDLPNLPISAAISLAAQLGVSLDWLAGQTREPSPPCTGACRFKGKRIPELRRRARVSERSLRQALDRMTLSSYRRMVNGQIEPTLAQCGTIASTLGVNVTDFVLGTT